MLPTPPPSPTLRALCPPEDRLGHTLPNGIVLTAILGVGAYGVVYRAQDPHTGVAYAVKALNKSGLDHRQRKFLRQEIQLHQQASRHPNVVSIFQIFDSVDCTYVVMEYCPEGDLFGNITDQERYVGNDFLARRVFLQLLDAVEFCHNSGIYHRDLKPENVLVTDGGMTVKLADFGLATTSYWTSDFGCGSTFYMSPECLQPATEPFECYSSAANDVWSLGVVLVNLTCGRNPWKKASLDDPTFNAFYQDPGFLKTILPLSDELEWILQSIFQRDPLRRVTIPQLREMVLRCSSFTAQTGIATTTPPSELREYPHGDVNNHVAGIAPIDDFLAHHPVDSSLVTQFSHMTTSSVGSDSDNESVFSTTSSASSTSSSGYYSNLASESVHAPKAPIKDYPNFVSSHANPTTTWYSNIFPAFDLAQKHMSFQPLFNFNTIRPL